MLEGITEQCLAQGSDAGLCLSEHLTVDSGQWTVDILLLWEENLGKSQQSIALETDLRTAVSEVKTRQEYRVGPKYFFTILLPSCVLTDIFN